MACKYKYNNQWYSKEELQNILYKERGIDKYGKLVKPIINKKLQDNIVVSHKRTGVIFEGTQKEVDNFLNNFNESIYGYLDKSELKFKQDSGIQPVQTIDNIKESIESVKFKIAGNSNGIYYSPKLIDKEAQENIGGIIGGYWIEALINNNPEIFTFNTLEEADDFIKVQKGLNKEYTEQALINIKIAALKEVAKKYPRSLIRSEVKKEEYQSQNYSIDDFEDVMPFQKIPSKDLSEELNNTTDLNLTCFL